MTFNIGSQSGGVINNVGGDQHVTGGQHGVVITAEQARQALSDLRAAVSGSPLDEGASGAARAELAEMDAAMQAAASPDRSRFASALGRLTRLLTAAGALASAGTALAGPLHILAAWVGTAV